MTTIERLQKITEALETITGEVIALVKEQEPIEHAPAVIENMPTEPALASAVASNSGTEIHEDKPIAPRPKRRRKAPALDIAKTLKQITVQVTTIAEPKPDADRMRAAPEPLVAAPVEPLPVPKAKRRAKTEPIVGQMALNGKSVAAPITERLPGTTVWAAYKSAYVERYGIEPLRSAKVNSQCLVLAQQVGVDEACILIAYFLQRNDAFYVNAAHPIGLCLQQAQKLITELKTGEAMTLVRAQNAEKHAQTDAAIRDYIADKGESA
jgi:hypothetical protein